MVPERWRDLVSPKVGLIRQIAPQPRPADEPLPPHLYVATLANFDFRAAERSERIGAGKGRTEEEAIASAIGEAVERYCAFQWDPRRTWLAPWADVAEAAIAPSELVLYSDRQYASGDLRVAPWTPGQETTWIRGIELPSGRVVALPASLVYLVHPAPRIEDTFAPASSNGLAAGPSLAAAVLGGLCELMERDALLVAWMNRLPAVELDLPHSGSLAASVRRQYARAGVTLRAFALPSDLPATTVLALSLEDAPGRPAQVVGMGCHPDPEVALVKAVFELCQGRPSEGRRFVDKPPHGRLQHYEDVRTLDDHSAFVSQAERRGEFDFLSRGGATAAVGDLPRPREGTPDDHLGFCVERLTALGVRVAYCDLTLPDVAPYAFHVVRALATGLQPVHFGHGLERLGGRRLFEVPQRLGLAPSVRTEEDLNPCPHPLA
jgi:ribosomal protein S12 methylthiotransferase accessory factor